jgi:hypothetical protein
MNCPVIESEEFPLPELAQRLHAAWEEHRARMQKPVVRIASFNLLIVSSGETDPELATIVGGLQRSHPCRMIWTKLKPEKAWSESTGALTVQTRCDGLQVCGEQLILRCGNERQRIASLVLPLIHSGLPTHLLWWKSGPLDCPLFRRLQDRARLVLWQPDSPPSNWALEFLERTWSDPYQLEHAVYPVDWFRLLGRRQQIANAYDRGPVTVKARDPGAEMSLVHRLLKGWLEARLGQASEVTFRWTSGAPGCCIDATEPVELPLLDDVRAIRIALDNANRDPVFWQTLKAMLAPATR